MFKIKRGFRHGPKWEVYVYTLATVLARWTSIQPWLNWKNLQAFVIQANGISRTEMVGLFRTFSLTFNMIILHISAPITKSQNNVTFATTESTPSSGKLTSLHAMTSAARYRSARIPFTADQVQVMERKFYRSPYLSGSDVTGLAKELQLSETRVRSPFVRSFYVVDQLGFDYVNSWSFGFHILQNNIYDI